MTVHPADAIKKKKFDPQFTIVINNETQEIVTLDGAPTRSSQVIKGYGVKSQKVMAEFYDLHPETLTTWHKTRPNLFIAACENAAILLNCGVTPGQYILQITKEMEDFGDRLREITKQIPRI